MTEWQRVSVPLIRCFFPLNIWRYAWAMLFITDSAHGDRAGVHQGCASKANNNGESPCHFRPS